GVSAYDLMLRSGRFPGFPKPPFTPGVDIVGVVDRLGDDVTSVTEGQMVAGLMFSANGGYAELVCVPEGEIVPVPAGVD
ncbi:MAG: alcohol dehydrogenase catalytic domain-containing protein, partial [Actinobacteria bacterium]|nr:alcohol dehydrogenase catalytic domain-containing protein [Actinomycetota bacterium]NIS35563.1 alcohol dehydrogenase catalytic domain-containing protein [Actinomycetota bacterium]NIT98195.1 alcohol dehydrogenase catalytic domain-containing protein [Actinomycetota bacterium]NIU70222.1 alcohol dehydrogenase catalytic domain-containing protein [Actinomycetota bacterium]NIV58370.1 alcohol dehydrogenase catalytic domain-containing protein [Actinomycetota bacterium]